MLPTLMPSAGMLPAGEFVLAFSSTITPLGVALPELFVTAPLKLTLLPTVPEIVDGEIVTMVLINPGVDHLLIMLATFIEPSPVARSSPAPAANDGVVPDANTPNPPLAVLLQFVEPPAHGTELLPLVTSLKTQVVFVALPLVPSLELQLEKVSLLAMAYSVTFALPCRCPVF